MCEMCMVDSSETNEATFIRFGRLVDPIDAHKSGEFSCGSNKRLTSYKNSKVGHRPHCDGTWPISGGFSCPPESKWVGVEISKKCPPTTPKVDYFESVGEVSDTSDGRVPVQKGMNAEI
jgi:hypothetical protein